MKERGNEKRKKKEKERKRKILLHHNLILIGAYHILKATLVVNSWILKHLYEHVQGLHFYSHE